MSFSSFSAHAQKAAKAITHLWETGKFVSPPETIAVLPDKAGITFGKSQTTENSGGLWKLLFVSYPAKDGTVNFSPYKELLFKKGDDKSKRSTFDPVEKEYSGGLTNDAEFKELLVHAAKDDPAMSEAQDLHFHENFFKPALFICTDEENGFNLKLPLSLAFVYDFCIQSGPGSRWNDGTAFDRLSEWNSDYEEPDDIDDDDEDGAEKAWLRSMCIKRDNFLAGIPHARFSRYRTGSMLKMMKEGSSTWNLQTPLSIMFLRKDYTGKADKVFTLTDADLEHIKLTE